MSIEEEYALTFSHEEKLYYYKSDWLYEIQFYVPLEKYQLDILKKLGVNFIQLHVKDKDQNCEMNFLKLLIKDNFPSEIEIIIDEMSYQLVYFLRWANLRKLIVSTRTIGFFALKSLLSINCVNFDFSITNLIDIPSNNLNITISSNCISLDIVIEKRIFINNTLEKEEGNENIPIILRMSPNETHDSYYFNLPDFMKLVFNRTTQVTHCLLKEKDLTHATKTLEHLYGMKTLKLVLYNGDNLQNLPSIQQVTNFKDLKLRIIDPLYMTPQSCLNA